MSDWTEANQRHLTEALAEVRALLEAKLSEGVRTSRPHSVAETSALDRPFALEAIVEMFGLSSFERLALVLCAGMELDSAFASLCAQLHGDTARPYPTFSLLLGTMPDAHWSALTPAAPLRRHRLIEVGSGGVMTTAPLRIDERVLHYLTGIDHPDERLAGMVEVLSAPSLLVASHEASAARLTTLWSTPASWPRLQLCGSDAPARRAVAAAACERLGIAAHAMSALALPPAPADLDGFVRLWHREACLSGTALLLECDAVDTNDLVRTETVQHFVDAMRAPLIVSTREPRSALARGAVAIDVASVRGEEQRSLWLDALGGEAARANGALDRVIAQFSLAPDRIAAVAASVQGAEDLGAALWSSCRAAARPRLDDLAQRVASNASWEDLILPAAQVALLRDLVAAVRFRPRVYDDWGFAGKDWRGLGVTALFAGASGTGKTLAAEVIANALGLDLYRIDLSGVVSKYIGETEKNLRRVFDAAEEGGAILLFDEADALFGKRSEVKDSHDRYANIEVSYLLQRMEAYHGVAILTTNSREALDTAFLRRIRFAVQFPFPAADERAAIWARIFPRKLPTHGLDVAKLARLSVAGGNIRNIAVNAAFGAARDDSPLTMRHLLEAARAEFVKLEKALPASEVEEWV